MRENKLKQKKCKFCLNPFTQANSQKGFSLLEVLASSILILIAAGMLSQVIQNPKARLANLEHRASAMDYLDDLFTEVSKITPYPINSQVKCSDPSICNPFLCGTICTAPYTAGGSCEGTALAPNLKLTQLVQQNPMMCQAQATLKWDCDENVTANFGGSAAHLCAAVTWGKEGARFNEALTTFLYKS